MADKGKRPDFIELWLSDLADEYRRGGGKRLVPVWLITSFAVGWLVQTRIHVPEISKPEVSLVFFGALVTLNGLLLTLAWVSFSKIYDVCSDTEFAAYLNRASLVSHYFFLIDYIQKTQIFALLCSAASLTFSVCSDVPPLIARALVICSIGSTLYAFRYAIGAVSVMQDVVWYRIRFGETQKGSAFAVHDGGRPA